MPDLRRTTVLALALVTLSFCGYRERGLEVALELGVPELPSGVTIDVERVELLACPDVPSRIAALSLVPVARAHDERAPAMGPVVLSPSATRESATLAVRPGSYCDVRVDFGAEGVPALVAAAGDAGAREVVLRLVDERGVPTRLVLTTPPDHAAVRVELGTIDDVSAPAHALSELVDGATATAGP